jgi:hypothetical protein
MLAYLTCAAVTAVGLFPDFSYKVALYCPNIYITVLVLIHLLSVLLPFLWPFGRKYNTTMQTNLPFRKKQFIYNISDNGSEVVQSHISIFKSTWNGLYLMDCLTFNPPAPSKYAVRNSVRQ